MFERYTEKARRVIFFARYEASQFGSPYIESEHLLLGLLRENKALAARLVPKAGLESIRQEIDRVTLRNQPSPTSVDLPLSSESQRILRCGADEADRLAHKHIGTEHLLLGMLGEQGCLAAQILRRHNANAEEIRSQLARRPGDWTATENSSGFRQTGTLVSGTIEIHGSRLRRSYIQGAVARCRAHSWHWEKKAWTPRDIVVQRKHGRVSFDLSLAEDAANFELVKGGWKKDHCAVCRWELFETKDDATGVGYTNGREWVCTECYEKFWDRPDFSASRFSDIT